jgi:hypothetical protein
MLYLIEGADGLGKTTLAKALQWKVRGAYVHHCPPDTWRREQFFDVLPYTAVYDRFHWSMYAYGEVRKQPLDLDMDACAAIDQRLRERLIGDYTTVCLYASDPSYFDKMPYDHMFTKEAIKSVNDRYMAALQHFDYTIDVATLGYPSPEQVLDFFGI